MTTLNARVRSHIDAIAPPVRIDEVTHRPPSTPGRFGPTWPARAAAAVVLVAGLAATIVLLTDRNAATPSDRPVGTTSPAAGPTSTVTTTEPETRLKLTIEAGSTVEQIGEQVEIWIDTVDADEFVRAAQQAASASDLVPNGVASAEGLLAAGVYLFDPDSNASDIASAMVARTEELAAQSDIVDKAAALGRSPYEILTIASLVEKEARVPADRARISRVIHNRLFVTENNPDEDPFPLQLDAAVLYGRDQADIDRNIPFSELRQMPTDWNTYVNPGLPSTPIAAPSEGAIDAAAEPAPNPGPNDPVCVDLAVPDQCFWFFYVLADSGGSMAFAATAEQHEANIREARERGLL